MNIESLKDGLELGRSLLNHSAVYHKKCKKKFDDDKVKRAEKRSVDQMSTEIFNTDTQPVQKQSRRSNIPVEKLICASSVMKHPKKGNLSTKDTNNTILYSKLQNGDMCAQDAVYYSECICKLYRDANKVRFGADTNEENRKLHGLALIFEGHIVH